MNKTSLKKIEVFHSVYILLLKCTTMSEGLNLKILAHAVDASELSYHNNASLLQHPHLLSKQKLRLFCTLKLVAQMSSEVSREGVHCPSGLGFKNPKHLKMGAIGCSPLTL